MRLDLLSLRKDVRLVTINNVPQLVDRTIGFIVKPNDYSKIDRKIVLSFDADKVLLLDVPNVHYNVNEFDVNSSVPFTHSGRLYIPTCCLRDLETTTKDVVEGDYLTTYITFRYVNAIGQEDCFDIALSRELTEKAIQRSDLLFSLWRLGVKTVCDNDLKIMLEHYDVIPKEK